jgi:hypothetical protein
MLEPQPASARVVGVLEYRRTAGDGTAGLVCVRPSDEGTTMAVYSLFRNKPFEPEAISVLTGAYADVCRALGLGDGDRRKTDVVARKVIEFAQRGVSDRGDLREKVLRDLS